MRLTPALRHMLVERMHAEVSPRRGRVVLGDFDRRVPSLERDEVSVYDALVRRFLRPRIAAFAGTGLVLSVDAEPGWRDMLPAAAELKALRTTAGFERELGAAATADWVVLDRCLQGLPELTVALEEVVGRLKPGATLITLFTGIARPEPGRRRAVWSVAPYAARRLHEERRELERVEVEQYGNVTLAAAWLYRLPANDLTEPELATVDPAYPVLVGVIASRCRPPLPRSRHLTTPRARRARTRPHRRPFVARAVRGAGSAVAPPHAELWDWGDLRRLRPISHRFGYDRGLPIDRYYIERFLERHRPDIAGRTLEIGDDQYTRRYGGVHATHRDVLHVHDRNPAATIVANLADAPQIADETFDCIVLTQTLHVIYDISGAVATIHRILRPGGVVLATFPGISQLSDDEWSRTWSWALGSGLARRLFASRFDEGRVTVDTYGTSLAAVAFLQGLATEELTSAQLDAEGPGCELLVAVRAVK